MKIILFLVVSVFVFYVLAYLFVGASPQVYNLEISRDEFIIRLNKLKHNHPEFKSKIEDEFGEHDPNNYYFHIDGLPGADYYAKVFSIGNKKSKVYFQSYYNGKKQINGDFKFIDKKYKNIFRDSVILRIMQDNYK